MDTVVLFVFGAVFVGFAIVIKDALTHGNSKT
jgi:hypothetical protein